MRVGFPRCFRGTLLAAALLLPAASWAAVSFQDGMTSFEAGDYVAAAAAWRDAANDGDAYAQHALGKLYESGEGVPRDYGLAAEWYAKAAAQGLPAAENNLALLYSTGRGVPRDTAKAIALWLKAAEAGHGHAQYNLGLAYYLGQDVPRDDRTAAYWFTLSAQGGLAQAQFAIGQMRRTGLGIAKSEAVALVWYDRAAAQGHADAMRMAAQLRAAGVEPNPQQAEQKPYLSPLMALPPQPAVPQLALAAAAPTLIDGVVPPPLKPNRAVDTSGRAAATPAVAKVKLQPDPQGSAMVWLGSADDEGEARNLADLLTQRFPDIFDAMPPAAVKTGAKGYRVLAGPLSADTSAQELCKTLRSVEPTVFCKVVPRA